MQIKKEIPEELVVKIEKLSNLGYGIARYNGYVIFVANACPEDSVKIRFTKKNKNFGNAEITEIIKPSPYRIEPFCKMQKVCGACQLQFIEYDAQLKYKKSIVEDSMQNILGQKVEIRDVIPSPQIKEYRHKIQYPVSQTKESKRILAGYYKAGSHNLVNIKHCPIQPQYCDEIIEFIRIKAQELGISGYDEKSGMGELRHVVIRASYTKKECIVVLTVNTNEVTNPMKKLAECIYTEFRNVKGISVNFNNLKTNLILGERTELFFGNDCIEDAICGKKFKIGAKTFFQVNPSAADCLFRYVKDYIENNFDNPVILDAYAGITAFGICMSDAALKIVSIEEINESVELAKQVIEEHGIENIELNSGDAEKFLSEQSEMGVKYDITILDPPRKGCTEKCLENAIKLTNDKIIYVSCNPSTLARDLKYLSERGAKVQYIQPFDMFPHTYHIENVAIINVKK